MSGRAKRWNGPAMAHDGCIVSFVSASGDELTLHRTGPLRAGLRQACVDALAVDPTFRVTCYSTPTTIADDLAGARMDFDRAKDGRRTEKPLPESSVLGQLGLWHMAHPSLRLSVSETDAVQRARARCTCLPDARRRNCPVHGEGYAAGDVFAQELADTRDTERAKWRRDHPERYR